MTDEQWDTFALLLDKGFKWREPFAEGHELTYRTLLDGYDPEQIAYALRQLIARGQVFGPTPGEIVKLIRSDPGQPTFDVAYQAIYGRGGALRARPRESEWPGLAEMYEAQDRAVLERAREIHPLVGEFVRQQGVRRLRMLPVDDPDEGHWSRKELREAWDRLVAATETREVAAIASGRGDGLRGLDPTAALTLDRRALGVSDPEAGS